MLNTIVAESLDYIATQARGRDRGRQGRSNDAIQDLLPEIIKESKNVIFNGDNYTEEWHDEAEKRGLPDLTHDARVALKHVDRRRSRDRDVRASTTSSPSANSHSRYEVYIEQYVIKTNIEAETTYDLAKTTILPAAVRYLSELEGRRGRRWRTTSKR